MIKQRIALSAVTGILIVCIGLAAADNASATAKHGRTVVGSWIINSLTEGFPPRTDLGTFTRGGAVINTDPDGYTGHGAWKRAGRGAFAVKFITLLPPDHPMFPPGTYSTATVDIDVAKRGDTGSGSFVVVYENPDFTDPLLELTGTIMLKRITAD